MKRIKWLLTLADGKPLLFSVALLLIAVVVLSSVIIDRDKRIDSCEDDRKEERNTYSRTLDSLSSRYHQRELQLNEEVKSTLTSVIDDYKQQLEEQKQINSTINNTIKKNRKLINTTKNH